jgi:hypothetical protein
MKLAIALAALPALLAGAVHISLTGAGARLDMLTARLTLSEEQRNKLPLILEEPFAMKTAPSAGICDGITWKSSAIFTMSA